MYDFFWFFYNTYCCYLYDDDDATCRIFLFFVIKVYDDLLSWFALLVIKLLEIETEPIHVGNLAS